MLYCKTCNKIYTSWIIERTIGQSQKIIKQHLHSQENGYLVIDIEVLDTQEGTTISDEHFCPTGDDSHQVSIAELIRYTDILTEENFKEDSTFISDMNKIRRFINDGEDIDLKKLTTLQLKELKEIMNRIYYL